MLLFLSNALGETHILAARRCIFCERLRRNGHFCACARAIKWPRRTAGPPEAKFKYFNSNFNRRPRPKNMHMKMQKSGLLCATLSNRLLEARNDDSLGRSGLFRASSGMSARTVSVERLLSCFCRQKLTTASGEIEIYNPSAR